ncbi:hypothetical protein E5288_WYG008866 [Bos mutus]|uniref:Checkpoint protein HUS1 n=1 Tax=Bos mutus TaxID=72004 RepID=A0A6B0QU34_9CETA|nr:hypothetical protein [Bos mutus]
MKFRAKIVDTACLNHFTRVSNMIAKLAKTCTLRISPDKLNFILSDRVANGGVSMWCELEQENFFSEFQMEGVSAENNEIYLELTSENLSRALKTAQNARALKIKLTNKHFPCLTVSIELLSVSSSSRVVTHDIPVKVIPRKLWKDLQEPTVPDADVSIYLPVLKTMKSVVEKMKNISNHLIIEANLNGELNLKIETELVCVTTHFKDLGNPPLASENASQDRNLEQMAEVHIDIRKLLQFLAGQQVNPTKATCSKVIQLLNTLETPLTVSMVTIERGISSRKVSSLVEAPDEVDEHGRNGREGKRLRADFICYFSCKMKSEFVNNLRFVGVGHRQANPGCPENSGGAPHGSGTERGVCAPASLAAEHPSRLQPRRFPYQGIFHGAHLTSPNASGLLVPGLAFGEEQNKEPRERTRQSSAHEERPGLSPAQMECKPSAGKKSDLFVDFNIWREHVKLKFLNASRYLILFYSLIFLLTGSCFTFNMFTVLMVVCGQEGVLAALREGYLVLMSITESEEELDKVEDTAWTCPRFRVAVTDVRLSSGIPLSMETLIVPRGSLSV